MTFWRMSGNDWSTSAALSLFADLHGYIRINRRGREAAGVVEPGAPFDALCGRIAEGLGSFVDADTGAPVVALVARAIRCCPGVGHGGGLPDLIVRWSDAPAAGHRAVRSAALGAVAWPTPGRNPEGRSGNHRPEGFLIAAGPGVARGDRAAGGQHRRPRALDPCAARSAGGPAMTGRSLVEEAVVV